MPIDNEAYYRSAGKFPLRYTLRFAPVGNVEPHHFVYYSQIRLRQLDLGFEHHCRGARFQLHLSVEHGLRRHRRGHWHPVPVQLSLMRADRDRMGRHHDRRHAHAHSPDGHGRVCGDGHANNHQNRIECDGGATRNALDHQSFFGGRLHYFRRRWLRRIRQYACFHWRPTYADGSNC